jgi:hypothetical protein
VKNEPRKDILSMGLSQSLMREQHLKHDKASVRVRPGYNNRANVEQVSREHGRASCFPDEQKPVLGQLVDPSPGISKVSHRWYKRNNETRQGYPIRTMREVKKRAEAVLTPS